MKPFKLQIAAPDGLRYDGDACQLSVRGIAGELAVLAGHIPFVTAVRDCECFWCQRNVCGCCRRILCGWKNKYNENGSIAVE